MFGSQQEPRIAPWVEDGFDVVVAEMAPMGWEPPTDDEEGEEADEKGVEAVEAEADTGGVDTTGSSTGADEGETDSSLDLDETPEIARERAHELLCEYYETESDAEYALDELLNRGWFYEVDGQLRVTEPEW